MNARIIPLDTLQVLALLSCLRGKGIHPVLARGCPHPVLAVEVGKGPGTSGRIMRLRWGTPSLSGGKSENITFRHVSDAGFNYYMTKIYLLPLHNYQQTHFHNLGICFDRTHRWLHLFPWLCFPGTNTRMW